MKRPGSFLMIFYGLSVSSNVASQSGVPNVMPSGRRWFLTLAAFAPDPAAKEREEEERIAKKLREEIARIRAMHTKKGANMASAVSRESSGVKKEGMDTTGARVDKEKVLKVSWEKVGEDYTAEGLRELFSKFGEVDDVVIKSSKKKGSALVVMATKDAAVS
jgi:DnaJ family protein C protein 17